MSTGGSAGNAPGEAPTQRNPLYSSGEQGANLAAHPLSPSGTATPGTQLGSGAMSALHSYHLFCCVLSTGSASVSDLLGAALPHEQNDHL